METLWKVTCRGVGAAGGINALPGSSAASVRDPHREAIEAGGWERGQAPGMLFNAEWGYQAWGGGGGSCSLSSYSYNCFNPKAFSLPHLLCLSNSSSNFSPVSVGRQ